MACEERYFSRGERRAVKGGSPEAIWFVGKGASDLRVAEFNNTSEKTERHGEDW